MKATTYNGWTNYATWRVNLEIFDNWELGAFWGYEDKDPKEVDIHSLAEDMKTYVQEILDDETHPDSFARSYAHAFIDEVNWYELAKHIVDTQIECEQAN